MEDIINWTNLKAALDAYAAEVEEILKEKITAGDHIASHKLINTLEYQVDIGGGAVSVSLSFENYLKYLDLGTKPHFPPIGNGDDGTGILSWVRAKKLVQKAKTYDGKLPTEKQLAYLIARKISKVGTEPTHIMTDAIEEVNARYELIIGDAIEKDLDEGINAILIRGFSG